MSFYLNNQLCHTLLSLKINDITSQTPNMFSSRQSPAKFTLKPPATCITISCGVESQKFIQLPTLPPLLQVTVRVDRK